MCKVEMWDNENGKGYDLKPKTVTQKSETYRIYRIAEADIDKLAVRMLTSNNIKGLLKASYSEGELKFRITNMQSLYDFVHTNNTSRGKHMLLKLLGNMISSALELDEYMLSIDKLLLNPKEIYVDEGLREVFMPYIPINNNNEKNVLQSVREIKEFCSMLLRNADEYSENKEEEISEASSENMEDDEYGSTEAFENLQKNAKESIKLKEDAKENKEKPPYLIRKRTGERIDIDRNIFKLGKDEGYVDYCIKNPTVSRNHADIVRKPDGYYLIDKGSLNHTFVNGRKLETDEYRKLEDGCLMQLADEVFEFRR